MKIIMEIKKSLNRDCILPIIYKNGKKQTIISKIPDKAGKIPLIFQSFCIEKHVPL